MTRIRANGIELEYEDIGPRDGVPFLYINGFGTQLTGWPEEYAQGFAKAGLRYIRFDNRDVGLTQKWTGQIPDLKAVGEALREGRKPDIPYTLDDMAADAAGLLDALGIESAHISGASMGGMIAQLVALNHPEKARSLISIFSTTSDRSLPPSSPEAQAALVTRPPSSDRDAVVAHSLKGRRAYASTRWPFDEARLSALVGRNFDRSYYPEGTSRQYSSYCGNYTFDGRTLTTIVDANCDPVRFTAPQVRKVRFDGERMILTPPPAKLDGVEVTRELTWERISEMSL